MGRTKNANRNAQINNNKKAQKEEFASEMPSMQQKSKSSMNSRYAEEFASQYNPSPEYKARLDKDKAQKYAEEYSVEKMPKGGSEKHRFASYAEVEAEKMNEGIQKDK
ncbi:hypothetical protein M1E11_06175 [Bacillus sp. JZ8]